MYCPSCAAPIDGSKFCRSCGANVSLIPQALSGQLPQAESADRRQRRRRHHGKKEPSVETAASTFFRGIGFIFAALAVMRFFPSGIFWGWSLFIPGFACIGDGIGHYLRWKELRREKQQFNPPVNYQTPVQPAQPVAEISAPTTSELRDPSSITEHTTRHLDASQRR
jgi:hypothetical protein